MECDTSYLNTTPGKYKITALTLGAIGLIAVNVTNSGGVQYVSSASFAFLVTLVILLVLLCQARLAQSPLVIKIEAIICLILTIVYIVATIDIIRVCWHYLFHNFVLGPFIGSLIASICSVFATSVYLTHTIAKFREGFSSSTSMV